MSPLLKLVLRGDTTLVDAYLSPVLERYVASVRRGLDRAPRRRAAAVHAEPRRPHGRRALRGQGQPAVGARGRRDRHADAPRARPASTEVIGFDMGGTSTDVSLYAGELERTADAVIAAVRVSAPMLKIHTVAAGGGSIVVVRERPAPGGARVRRRIAGARVLPQRRPAHRDRRERAARAHPARLLPARVRPERRRAARRRRDDRARSPRSRAAWPRRPASARRPSSSRPAASASPSSAWRTRSSRSRCSAATTSRASRSAASAAPAGQHACQVADALGIGSIVIHPLAGVLSALRHRRRGRARAAPSAASRRRSTTIRSRRSRRSSKRSRPRRAPRSRAQGVDAAPQRDRAALRAQDRGHRRDAARRCSASSRARPSSPPRLRPRTSGISASARSATRARRRVDRGRSGRGGPHTAGGLGAFASRASSGDTPEDRPWGSAAHIPVRRRSRRTLARRTHQGRDTGRDAPRLFRGRVARDAALRARARSCRGPRSRALRSSPRRTRRRCSSAAGARASTRAAR